MCSDEDPGKVINKCNKEGISIILKKIIKKIISQSKITNGKQGITNENQKKHRYQNWSH